MVTSTICFIACHGGSADHFATFKKNLPQEPIAIYAAGQGLKKFQEAGISVDHSFSYEKLTEEEQDCLQQALSHSRNRSSTQRSI